jgi:hypothetical protein
MASDAVTEGREALAGADVRRGVIAVVAGWAVPGLGHVVVGRWRRGVIFAAIIMICFALGMLDDGRLSLRDREQPFLSTLQVVANAGVGVPDVLARLAVYGELTYALPRDESYPVHHARSTILRQRARSGLSLYGTAYLWTAGLMNLLVLFDVWDLGTGRRV